MSVRLLLLALFTIGEATAIHGAPVCQRLSANGARQDAGSNAVASSVARLVQTRQRCFGEGGVHLSRQLRQTKLLCLGNAVVTTLVSTLLERNRQRIKENEPINIGGTQNLGVIILKNGRGVNVHTAFFNGEIEVDCTTDPEWISITFPVGMRNPDVVFDYELPGGLLSGELKARFELFGANVVLRLPKDRSGDLKPYIGDVNFWSTQGFKMEITGMGPVSSALTTGLALVYQLVPMPLMEFFRVLMMRVMQQFLETAPLPF
nr:uncharacterized protein LOC119165073 [Rhipicephalus microplus]